MHPQTPDPIPPVTTIDPPSQVTRTTTVTAGPAPNNAIDHVLYLLFAGMVIFAIAVFLVEKFFPMDGQIFQVMAGLLTGFSGAFFTRIKGNSDTK
jgi:hypothetical protein